VPPELLVELLPELVVVDVVLVVLVVLVEVVEFTVPFVRLPSPVPLTVPFAPEVPFPEVEFPDVPFPEVPFAEVPFVALEGPLGLVLFDVFDGVVGEPGTTSVDVST
jgi:hypothetical protein